MRTAPRLLGLIAALLISAVLEVGCATHPTHPATAAPSPSAPANEGAVIAAVAASLVGTPYHFGGADATGFDCSGLALYVHQRAGIAIPRTAVAQQRAARPVALAELAPGDLVFFRIRARRAIDHVGIYAGAGRFIHAPRAGQTVNYADLTQGFYARRLRSAGRFW
jgi:cell wall-associated NlpC family hydrolase